MAKSESVGVNGEATKEIRWTKNKLVVLNAMKAAGATSATNAATLSAISKASKGKVTEKQIKHQCNPNWCLVAQDIVRIAKHESGTTYFLTPKGVKQLAANTAAK